MKIAKIGTRYMAVNTIVTTARIEMVSLSVATLTKTAQTMFQYYPIIEQIKEVAGAKIEGKDIPKSCVYFGLIDRKRDSRSIWEMKYA